MHFALPPRKSSFPPPYARASNRGVANGRRLQIQYLSYAVLCTLSLYLVYTWIGGTSVVQDASSIPADSSILIVTVFDENMSQDHMTMIKVNRDDYAARHGQYLWKLRYNALTITGYKTHYANTSSYTSQLDRAPSSWALIPALRHALTLHPKTEYIWSLSPHALITNFTLNLHSHILQPLPTLMQKDIPVVPPDSVIHTFSHLTPTSTNLILSQDLDNLAHTSFLLRNTLSTPVAANKPKDTWTYFFLDAWFDPLYRAYAFQKAENHALEHIVQWHPTILAKLVIIPQRRLNSYNFEYGKGQADATTGTKDAMWKEGDLVVNFKGCEDSEQRDCEGEMRGYFEKWMRKVEKVGGGHTVDVKLNISHEEYAGGKRMKKSEKS